MKWFTYNGSDADVLVCECERERYREGEQEGRLHMEHCFFYSLSYHSSLQKTPFIITKLNIKGYSPT